MMILENVELIIHEPLLENQQENIFNDIIWRGDVVRQNGLVNNGTLRVHLRKRKCARKYLLQHTYKKVKPSLHHDYNKLDVRCEPKKMVLSPNVGINEKRITTFIL